MKKEHTKLLDEDMDIIMLCCNEYLIINLYKNNNDQLQKLY